MVVHGSQRAGGEDDIFTAVPCLDGQRFAGAKRLDDLLQVELRDREHDGNRAGLGDHNEPAGFAGADEITGINLAETKATGDGSLDAGIGELAAGILDLGLLRGEHAEAFGDEGLLAFELLR